MRSSARSASGRCASVDSATDAEELERVGKRLSAVIARPPRVLPPREERLEDFVQQLTAFLRAQTGLVFSFLVEPQHPRREVLERALRDSARHG